MVIKVSVEEGIKYSQAGTWKPNPKYDPLDTSSLRQPEHIWQAYYVVHARPEPGLPEHEQYYLVEAI